jgi:SAM-dependent methyltransferase
VNDLETALAAFYDQESTERAGRELDPRRVAHRQTFIELVHAEGRSRVIEIGVGPGRDAMAFLAEGLAVSGVDLSAEHVALSRAAGVDARVASVLDLPFADGSFDTGWCMSTLLHVPNVDLDAALTELRRVLVPGSPMAIGLWGGIDAEGTRAEDVLEPRRFFSIRSDSRLHELLGQHGTVERFDTWARDRTAGWHYQWCVLRTR